MDDKKGIIGLEGSTKDGGLAERKARLLRQGDFYRTGIIHAKADIKHGARPETLFHNAIDHATWAVRSRVDGLLQPTGVSVSTILPYATSILSFIQRRRLGKPALGIVTAAAAVAYYLQHRRAKLIR